MTVDATPAIPSHGHGHDDENYLTHETGWKSWAYTVDHKRIGLMYLLSVIFAFAAGGVFALLVRTELMFNGQTIMEADTYNQAFTLHGAIMVFLFIIPSIPAALGNFVLPIMLGAKDVAFPRLNLASRSTSICIGTPSVTLIAIVVGSGGYGVDVLHAVLAPVATTTVPAPAFSG